MVKIEKQISVEMGVYNVGMALITVCSVFIVANAYLAYRKLKNQSKSEKYQRSNCAVMYSSGYMSGWPPNTERRKPDSKELALLLEPIVYFIGLAEKTLDIAVMIINVEKYIEAVIHAQKRGVTVRLISQFEKNSFMLTKFRKTGVLYTLFVPVGKLSPRILHYKYMIRDIGTSNECVCVGSMNYTMSGATDNYENIVFTQKPQAIKQFHENFETCLRIIAEDNKNAYKRNILQSANII